MKSTRLIFTGLIIVLSILLTSCGNNNKITGGEPGHYTLQKAHPTANAIDDKIDGKSLPIEKAAQYAPFTLLKPLKVPFKIDHAFVTLNDVPYGKRHQEAKLEFYGKSNGEYLFLTMSNIDDLKLAGHVEMIKLENGKKATFKKSENTLELIWHEEGYSIGITLLNPNGEYTKNDLIKSANSLVAVSKK